MNASLRLRLALLVVCSVALTVALVLYLTWQRVGETMIGMEEKNFATLLLVEEERLNTATLNHLAAKVRSVLLRKAQLRDASARIQTLLQALAPEQAAGSGQGHTVLQPLLSAMDAASIGLVDDVDSIRMEILDTEKLKSRIRTLERANERDYIDIGKSVYEKFQENEVTDESCIEFCEAIEKRQEQIEDLKKEIDRIKGE